MSTHRYHLRRQELIADALNCIAQFDHVSVRQLAFWLYAKDDASALASTHRLVRVMLAKKLVLLRRAGDGVHRYILTRYGAGKVGIKHGYDLSLLNAHLYNEIFHFLTVMHHQGFNVFGRGRIRREFPNFRDANGLVLDTVDDGFALVYIRNNTSATQSRIQRLKKLIEVRGLGHENLLKQLNVRQARTSD